MYRIRPADFADLPEILKIYAQARAFMAQSGNPTQWGDHYPPQSLLETDLREKNLYVVENGEICGVFALFFQPDPTYARIEGGAWLDDSPYATIHRVASNGCGGLFAAVLHFAAEKNRHLRIDTHEDNKRMQHILEKHGFRRTGIIRLEDGDPRIAYEKV